MAGSFEIKKAKNGQFYFNLKASNGEIILTSEMYKQKASAHVGIISVQKNSKDAGKYSRLVAKNGKPYFTLKAGNYQVIGNSEMYESTNARDKGVESVKKNGSTTTINDLTITKPQAKPQAKAQPKAKPKAPAKAKVPAKATTKAKAPAKAKVVAKAKVATKAKPKTKAKAR